MSSQLQDKRGGGAGAGIGAVAGLFFSNFNGPPLAFGDYILTFVMMILMFFTFFWTLKPASSKTMRGGDNRVFLVLLFSALLYFMFYLFLFLTYTLGPWENDGWQPSTSYSWISSSPILFYSLAFATLLCALLMANLRDFDLEQGIAQMYEIFVPPRWQEIVAVGIWLSLVGFLDFIISFVQILPSSSNWTASKFISFQRASEALNFIWDVSRLIAVAWLWACCWWRQRKRIPGGGYHKASTWFIAPCLLLASIALLTIDADNWGLFTRNKLTVIANSTFTLAYRITQTAPDWFSFLILLNSGRGLAKARGDVQGIFQYGQRRRTRW